MKEIKLTQGMTTKVSDEDYEELSKNKWSFDRYAYRTITVGNGKKRSVRMHRVITNAPKGMDVDHINGDKLDNRRENLRVCTRSENKANGTSNKGSSSSYKGVSWAKTRNKWKADISCLGTRYALGRFDSEVEAAKAYDKKAKELFGEYARTNF